jgi:hypothetical protein
VPALQSEANQLSIQLKARWNPHSQTHERTKMHTLTVTEPHFKASALSRHFKLLLTQQMATARLDRWFGITAYLAGHKTTRQIRNQRPHENVLPTTQNLSIPHPKIVLQLQIRAIEAVQDPERNN